MKHPTYSPEQVEKINLLRLSCNVRPEHCPEILPLSFVVASSSERKVERCFTCQSCKRSYKTIETF